MSRPDNSIPTILDCDPGHDDMVAILLAAAHPRIDLLAITTVAGNGTLERTSYNARAVCSMAGIRDVPIAAGAAGPLVGTLRTAANVHGESGLGGADLPRPDLELVPEHAVALMARLLRESATPVTLIPTGPLTNIALLAANPPRRRPAHPRDRPDGRLDRHRERRTTGRVQHLRRPGGRRRRLLERPRRHDVRAQRDPSGSRHRGQPGPPARARNPAGGSWW